MIKKTIFWLFLFFIFFITIAPSTNAGLEFQTDYQIIYQLGPRGSAQVHQEIKLTNKFSSIYPKEYHLIIKGVKPEKIKAWDSQGNILREIKEEQNSFRLKLIFNQKVVGKNKSLKFYLSYLLPQFAVKKGRV